MYFFSFSWQSCITLILPSFPSWGKRLRKFCLICNLARIQNQLYWKFSTNLVFGFFVFFPPKFDKDLSLAQSSTCLRVCKSNIFWKLCKLKSVPRFYMQSMPKLCATDICPISFNSPLPIIVISNNLFIEHFLRKSCGTENAVASLLCPISFVPVISFNAYGQRPH